MTREYRELAALEDIEASEFLCGNQGCGARITLLCNGEMEVPGKCPHCGHPWFEQTKEMEKPYGTVQMFSRCIFDLKSLRAKLGCTVKLELTPDPKQSTDGK